MFACRPIPLHLRAAPLMLQLYCKFRFVVTEQHSVLSELIHFKLFVSAYGCIDCIAGSKESIDFLALGDDKITLLCSAVRSMALVCWRLLWMLCQAT